MRSALQLVALVAALAACAADPVPLTACTAGVSTACTCSSGAQGAQVCAANGSGYGACVCSGGDAGSDAGDAADAGDAVAVGDAGTDALQLDAAADGGGDAVAVVDATGDGSADGSDGSKCAAGYTYCTNPDLGCFHLSDDPQHCGRCTGGCAVGAPRCVDGRCVP